MEHHPCNKNVREGNHNHPPREGNKEDQPQETSLQLVEEDSTKKMEKGLNQDGSLPEGQRKRQCCSEFEKDFRGWDPEYPEDGQNEKVNQYTTPPNKPWDEWEE